MAGFLYYIQHREPAPPSLEKIRDVGLGHAFDAMPECARVKSSGPDGAEGFVLGEKSRMGDWSVAYRPAEQEWRKLPCGAYVGWWREGPPTPGDLARPVLLAGYTPEMADGKVWQVPVIRNVDNVTGDASCGLPSVLTMDSTGKLGRGGPVSRYRDLWESTEWCWDAMISGEEIDDQRAVEAAGMVLGANYYVSAYELCLLEVFSDEKSPVAILSIANQGHIYAEWKAVQEANRADLKNSECQVETPGEDTNAGAGA